MTNKASKTARQEPEPIKHTSAEKARMATMPSLNAAAVIHAYQGNVVGKDVDMSELVSNLQETFKASKDGDLGRLENMLIGQATALQTIFTNLARRAQLQEYQKNYESFLSLALKAQSQSRATIQAIAEIKYPKQVAFVGQANISHGPQQVNNGTVAETDNNTTVRAEENQFQQNKLLEANTDGSANLDHRATKTAGSGNKAMEAMGSVYRAEKPRGEDNSLP